MSSLRRLRDLERDLAPAALGIALHDFVAEAYPLCRSLTGDGVRATLAQVRRHLPLELHEVPSGTRVFDWTVPDEWNIRDGYIADLQGRRVVDWRANNLHVVGYSRPIRARLSLSELRSHLHTLPDRPAAVPYRTSYYADAWGFCLAHDQLEALPEGEYDVCIDATLEPGYLTYAELLIPGERRDEVLVSCHICHPSLCNDNLSGLSIATLLAEQLLQLRLRHSHRFLFIPGTIGSITWLARNESLVERVKHGVVVTGLGDPGPLTYKRSRRGDTTVDQAAEHVLKQRGQGPRVRAFTPFGYDERQYCSPGFDLPVGCLMRTPYGEYPEYHTSADNLEFVRPQFLADSYAALVAILRILDEDGIHHNLNPKCEPQLGRRGVYRTVGGDPDIGKVQLAMLWVLNLSDGSHTLLDIANRASLPFGLVRRAADLLTEHGLLSESTAEAIQAGFAAGRPAASAGMHT